MKILVIRLSSLGDLILSTSFLETLPDGIQVDWIVSKEFEFLLKDHPRIRKVIPFDKKTGIRGWFELLKTTLNESYDYRVDLHSTLRSNLALFYYRLHDSKTKAKIQWKSISKERLKHLTLLSLKKMTPKWAIPTPYWIRFARVALDFQNASHDKKIQAPSFLWMLKDASKILEHYDLHSKNYVAIMPASRWKSKEWASGKYLELILRLHAKKVPVLLLGRNQDKACRALVEQLEQRQIPFKNALEENDFTITSQLLHHASAYLGGDTGLAHLSEAVGTPSLIIFGPTRPEIGFGPRLKESRAIHANVFCSPCSKDGKICFRITDSYACLKRISVDQVQEVLAERRSP